jgi:hypothetical protein
MHLYPHTKVRLCTKGIDIKIRELSFVEYKSFCKSLFSHENISDLSELFDNIILKTTDITFIPNILDKIVILIFIREITIGKHISLLTDNVTVNIPTDIILDKINKKIEPIDVAVDGIIYHIELPTNFTDTLANPVRFIQNSISSVTLKEGTTVDLRSLTEDEREKILSYLPTIPVTDIHSKITSKYSNYSVTIKLDKEYVVHLLDGSFIHFFKYIYDEKYQNVLNFEYDLRRHLRFNTYDFETMPYPECKILIDKFKEEIKTQEKQQDD